VVLMLVTSAGSVGVGIGVAAGVGIGVALAPEHGWPWLAAGALVAVAWVAGAVALLLLRAIAARA
jgi:hypothetical protein